MPCVLERCAAQQVRQLLPRPIYPKRASGSWRSSQAPDASAPDRPHVVPRTAIPPGPPIAPRVRFATRCCRPDRAPARPGRRRDLQLLSGECEHVGGDARGASSGRAVGAQMRLLLFDEGSNLARGSPVGRRAFPRGARKCGSTTRKNNERVGLFRWSSAPRANERTRSASPVLPLSTITGSSGSMREASPSAARTRSSSASPLPSSSVRSSTTSAGWRTSIARSPSPAPLAPATRNPSAARLSSRKARVRSSSSTTSIRRGPGESTSARSDATQNLAPDEALPALDYAAIWLGQRLAGSERA